MESPDKKLMRACARYIMGESISVKLKASPEALESLQSVLTASRDLYNGLNSGKSLSEVRSLLRKKSAAAEIFHQKTGLIWAL